MNCVLCRKNSWEEDKYVKTVDNFSSFLQNENFDKIHDGDMVNLCVYNKYLQMDLCIKRDDTLLEVVKKSGLSYFKNGAYYGDNVYKRSLNSAVWKVARKTLYEGNNITGVFKHATEAYVIRGEVHGV